MSLLTNKEKKELILIARKAIEVKLFGKSNLRPKLDFPVFQSKKGAFVTIDKSGKLRGCIGTVEFDDTLINVVQRMAVSAAFHDPRFQPLRAEEYSSIEIEVSILSEPRVIHNPDELVIGTHGLIISYGSSRGLLLPQVAVENSWTREEFLNHTCIKAHLDSDMWREKAKIKVFEAEVFAEGNL
ncbi:MAG: AmmeMemoRadiSam system protein A [bacterium]|nr:MAG: AmmeMemoRadiSam system protein A [bacterium]